MALAAAAVNAGVLGAGLPVIGYANYLLVWGSMHQWGFAWQDGTLTRARWGPWAMAAGGGAALAGLLSWSPFPVDMIGVGARVDNTSPPSIALLAFAAAQTGLVIALQPALSGLLTRARLWSVVRRLNPLVMTAYLWHMVPVIVVAVTLYPPGILPQPAVGSAGWWQLRALWLALLAAVAVPIIVGVTRLERPLLRLPTGIGSSSGWSAPALAAGIALVMLALARVAIAGFAPDGHVPWLVLAVYTGGLLLTLLSGGRDPGAGAPTRAPERDRHAPRITGAGRVDRGRLVSV